MGGYNGTVIYYCLLDTPFWKHDTAIWAGKGTQEWHLSLAGTRSYRTDRGTGFKGNFIKPTEQKVVICPWLTLSAPVVIILTRTPTVLSVLPAKLFRVVTQVLVLTTSKTDL